MLRPNKETGVISEEQAQYLLAGWSINDPEVSLALLNLAKSPNGASIAHLLPQIISDKKLCRDQLLDWLRSENNNFASLALVGLVRLGCGESDSEVVEAVVEKFLSGNPSIKWLWGISNVITYFPHHPKVREFALIQLRNCGGELDVVAQAYKDDREMRLGVLLQINVIPEQLRVRIVDRLVPTST